MLVADTNDPKFDPRMEKLSFRNRELFDEYNMCELFKTLVSCYPSNPCVLRTRT